MVEFELFCHFCSILTRALETTVLLLLYSHGLTTWLVYSCELLNGNVFTPETDQYRGRCDFEGEDTNQNKRDV